MAEKELYEFIESCRRSFDELVNKEVIKYKVDEVI